MMKWKYLLFLIVPAMGALSILGEGWWTYSAIVFAYGFIPLVELTFKADRRNASEAQIQAFKTSRFFDAMIYLVLPCYLLLLAIFLQKIGSSTISAFEYWGMVGSMGLMCGIMAINVGHELGHRHQYRERLLGELLLVFALQAHFLPYHNHGHHRNVATPSDPATARKNEPVFFFWFRSQIGSYISAWKIEWFRLSQRKKNPFSWANRMIRYTLMEAIIIVSIYWLLGGAVLASYLLVCLLGMLLLETVNYIEHYGLLRKQNAAGKYERVTPVHSWNSDHVLGRVLLFELSRHSDHHANPSKPYQLLNSYQESPQMPTGYPGMMLLSFIPPLWFYVMNRKLGQLQPSSSS